jgi:hypothetical protein
LRACGRVRGVFCKKQENTGGNAADGLSERRKRESEWTPARSTQPATVLAQELLSARVKVLLTSSPLAHGNTTAGRHTPLFPIDPNNGLINCSVYYVQFGEQQPAHLAVKWICARAVEHVMPGLAA